MSKIDKNAVDYMVEWIRKLVLGAGCSGVVLGLSGGLDSAVVAALCKKAFPEDSLGVIMPCHSHPEDAADGKMLAEHVGVEYKEVNLGDVFDSMLSQIGDSKQPERSLCLINLKPRLRMTTLYYFANRMNYLVAGTGNKSELRMGYFTKYGDGGVDFMPLGDLTKTQVRELAKVLGLPDKIINRIPTAGLFQGQTDEGEMGITYTDLDATIEGMERGDKSRINQKIADRIEALAVKIAHKFKTPPICQMQQEISVRS